MEVVFPTCCGVDVHKKFLVATIVATFNLTYNAGILAREGLGYVITLDKLIHAGADSELCFRSLVPILETPIYLIWKKYQVFTPIAELLLDDLRSSFGI